MATSNDEMAAAVAKAATAATPITVPRLRNTLVSFPPLRWYSIAILGTNPLSLIRTMRQHAIAERVGESNQDTAEDLHLSR